MLCKYPISIFLHNMSYQYKCMCVSVCVIESVYVLFYSITLKMYNNIVFVQERAEVALCRAQSYLF